MLTASSEHKEINQPQPGAASLRSMRDDAVDEVSDEEATDEPDDGRPRQNLSCSDCEATDFPNLSKLKSVHHRDRREVFSSQRTASIRTLINYHTNV